MNNVEIKVEKLTKVFDGNSDELVVFENLNVDFKCNELTAILGPSGCGKTTLLRLIAGLDEPTSGDIIFCNNNTHAGMIFQEYTAFSWLTVKENIRFGLRLNDIPKNEHDSIIDSWLEKTGLADFRNHYPSQLSGGMRQRLAFARCLATEPSIILMDEPFGSLDALTRNKMGGFAKELLTSLSITVLFVTHSIREAILLADRIIVLSSVPVKKVLEIDLKDVKQGANIKNNYEMVLEIEKALGLV